MRHWMPDVHLMWSEGVAHLLNESCRLGSILKPVCGPRVHGSRHDGDPSIKKMPTSKKITNVVICHSSSTVPQKKMMVLSPWMPRRQHGCDFSDSKCLLMDPEVCAGSHHGQRRTTYEGVRYAIVNATSLEECFRSSSWVTAVMKTGQIRDREKLGRCHGRPPQLSPRVTVQSGRVAWKNRLGRHRKFERFCLHRCTGRELDFLEE